MRQRKGEAGSRSEGEVFEQKTAAISTSAMCEHRGAHRRQKNPFSICCITEMHEAFAAPDSHPEEKWPDMHQKVPHSATKLILLAMTLPENISLPVSPPRSHSHEKSTDMKIVSWSFGPRSQLGWGVRLGSAELQAGSDPLKSDHPQTSQGYWTKKEE